MSIRKFRRARVVRLRWRLIEVAGRKVRAAYDPDRNCVLICLFDFFTVVGTPRESWARWTRQARRDAFDVHMVVCRGAQHRLEPVTDLDAAVWLLREHAEPSARRRTIFAALRRIDLEARRNG